MNINVNGTEYELSTKLRTIQKLETEFKMSVDSIFQLLGSAKTTELVRMIQIAAGEGGGSALREAMCEHWDYMDLVLAVRELLANMLFSGTAEQQEAKIEKFPVDGETKNELREMLGLPTKEPDGESLGKS